MAKKKVWTVDEQKTFVQKKLSGLSAKYDVPMPIFSICHYEVKVGSDAVRPVSGSFGDDPLSNINLNIKEGGMPCIGTVVHEFMHYLIKVNNEHAASLLAELDISRGGKKITVSKSCFMKFKRDMITVTGAIIEAEASCGALMSSRQSIDAKKHKGG